MLKKNHLLAKNKFLSTEIYGNLIYLLNKNSLKLALHNFIAILNFFLIT